MAETREQQQQAKLMVNTQSCKNSRTATMGQLKGEATGPLERMVGTGVTKAEWGARLEKEIIDF